MVVGVAKLYILAMKKRGGFSRKGTVHEKRYPEKIRHKTQR